MNELKVQLSLTYDNAGKVVGYKIDGCQSELVTIDVLNFDDALAERPIEAIGKRICVALNNEFDLPPIPGMQR